MQDKKAHSSRGRGRLRAFLELRRPWGFSPASACLSVCLHLRKDQGNREKITSEKIAMLDNKPLCSSPWQGPQTILLLFLAVLGVNWSQDLLCGVVGQTGAGGGHGKVSSHLWLLGWNNWGSSSTPISIRSPHMDSPALEKGQATHSSILGLLWWLS